MREIVCEMKIHCREDGKHTQCNHRGDCEDIRCFAKEKRDIFERTGCSEYAWDAPGMHRMACEINNFVLFL